LAEARGDYVALLDSDDFWMPWKLEVQLGCLRALPAAGMVWTDMEAIDPGGHVVSRSYLRTMYRGAYRWFPQTSQLFSSSRPLAEIFPSPAAPLSAARLYWGDIYSPMIMGNLVHTSTVLLRRERLARVRQFDESLKVSGEDYDFHLRTCREGPVAFIDVSSIRYQVGRPDQLSHRAYAIHMARNFLTTVSSALARDRQRIRLPARMIHAVQAFALGWVGVELIELGENIEAIGYLTQSLRHRAWQPRLWVYYVLSLLPSRFARFLLARLHEVAHGLRTLAHRQPGH
jgi:GT2 family glycosyltransferase